MLRIKTHIALIPLLLLANRDSLRWIPVWVRNGNLCLESERTVQKREIGYACPPLLMRFNARTCKQETVRKRRR